MAPQDRLQVGANRLLDRLNLGGLGGQFVVGAILGIAWSPCIGPTLGAASSLSLSATNVGVVLIIALMFSTGVSTVVLAQLRVTSVNQCAPPSPISQQCLDQASHWRGSHHRWHVAAHRDCLQRH